MPGPSDRGLDSWYSNMVCLVSPMFHLDHCGDPQVKNVVAWERGLRGGGIPLTFLRDFYMIKSPQLQKTGVIFCNY